MRTLGNILWFILGGFIAGTLYFLLGALFYLTVVGIPIGKALIQYGKLMYAPFGKAIVRETFIKGKENVSTARRVGGIILNTIWFPIGFIMMMTSIAQMLLCFVSIIWIPAGIVIARASTFLLMPIGAKVITQEEYQAILTANVIGARNGGNGDVDHVTTKSSIVPVIVAGVVVLLLFGMLFTGVSSVPL